MLCFCESTIDRWVIVMISRKRNIIIIMMSCCFVFRFVFHMWIVCYCSCNRFFCPNSLTVPNDDGVAHTFLFILYTHRLACQRIVINRNIQILINKPAAARMSRIGIVILSHRSNCKCGVSLCDDDDPIRLKEFGIFIQLLAAWFDQSIKFHFDIGLSILTRISSDLKNTMEKIDSIVVAGGVNSNNSKERERERENKERKWRHRG